MRNKKRLSGSRPYARGFRADEPMHQGLDPLHDKKLKTELAKMILQDHLKQVREHLPEDAADELAYRFMDSDGNQWIDGI